MFQIGLNNKFENYYINENYKLKFELLLFYNLN